MKTLIQQIFLLLFIIPSVSLAQFGKNKVQYKDFEWYFIQTEHFDIFFTQNGETLAEFSSKAAEDALASIQNSFKYKINNRITLIVYNSQNDFQETNVIDQYLSEGIEGFTELFKNRVVVQFMGSYKKFRHLIHHELVHAVMNDMFYGGSIQNIISNNISINIPLWFSEGMAEYQALGWDVDTDMFIRDAAINEYLPDIPQLGGYFAYRGGQAVFYYIDRKYGKEKIGELISKVRNSGNVDAGFKEAIGLNIEELNERWKKEIKRIYWPDIAKRKDPDEFSKRLTDAKKEGGSYNTSPAISPQGDKIAFLSNRDFYFDLYIMNASDGKIIKKLIKGNRTADFEELNILTPSLTWSPDGKRIALGAKSGGYDVVYLIDVDSEDIETVELKLDGVKSVTWSPDGKNLAFVGHTAEQSDIYLYELAANKLQNLTNDLFTESDPSWSNDGSKIFFSSDRIDLLSKKQIPDNFKIYKHNYNQQDIYLFDLVEERIERITDLKSSDEVSPIASPDGKHLIFISDINGINNIYRIDLTDNELPVSENNLSNYPIPITNSLNGLYQLSSSKDGKKISFTSLYQAAYNIFIMNNPFEPTIEEKKLEPTLYISTIFKKENEENFIERDSSAALKSSNNESLPVYVGNIIDTSRVYGDSVEIDFSNYVFGTEFDLPKDKSSLDSTKFNLENNLDKQGNYKVNKYKINFSPDIVYANAGYSSLYGLQGTTVISFSDVLGDHRLIGVTSLQIDLKNSDYGLAYYYLPERIDYGIEAFHTARFVYLSRGFFSDLVRFRNFGVVGSLSYPLNRFKRFDFGLSWLNLSQENLDNPSEAVEKISYLIPSLGFVHDNVLWGYTSPIEGSRYRFDLYGNPGLSNKRLSFYSLVGDYRRYLRFWTDYSFVMRYSGGYSGGNNPQRFFIGGIENWINRSFATTDIPLESASDFAFLTAALPLRGFNYAERIGTRYSLINMELRFPLIRYLVTGALPILFRNILGVVFVDAGAAWTRDKDLKLFDRSASGNVITKDLLMGTGVGARVFFLYFLMRFDVAWAYNVDGFTKPKFYLSLGADF
jgi:Tol biopolymer transport system component